jgi:hypothetical protein
MLASDAQNPEFTGAHNPDATLSVRFYSRPVQNMYQTEQQGRPIFEDVIYVEIATPGNDKNIIDTPMREAHKMRFPVQWAHYHNTHAGDARDVGTPLASWPLISAAQAEELKALKFRTVEHIANASDLNLSNIGMAGGMDVFQLRLRAQAFLRAASDSAAPQQQAVEIEKLRAEQAEKDAKHEREMQEMRDQIAALAANQKGKGGRPKKEAVSV